MQLNFKQLASLPIFNGIYEEVRSVSIILSGIVHMVKEESFSRGSHLDAHVSFLAAAPCTVLFLPFHKIEVISKKTLREKILTYLQQQALDQDSRQFTIPLNRLELAKYLCADRSALTRELSYMQKEGLISYEKNTFQLL